MSRDAQMWVLGFVALTCLYVFVRVLIYDQWGV